jgi:uncharacterized membrane protein
MLQEWAMRKRVRRVPSAGFVFAMLGMAIGFLFMPAEQNYTRLG